jgi:hypothetical protein
MIAVVKKKKQRKELIKRKEFWLNNLFKRKFLNIKNKMMDIIKSEKRYVSFSSIKVLTFLYSFFALNSEIFLTI